jgi:serine/threonine-protein phosphatase 6 catalytic subunit
MSAFSKQDIDGWLETVKGGTILPERELRILCEKVKEILIEESNV